jgi:hypothetical protein
MPDDVHTLHAIKMFILEVHVEQATPVAKLALLPVQAHATRKKNARTIHVNYSAPVSVTFVTLIASADNQRRQKT